MSFVVKTVTKLTFGFVFIYGIYIALSGHISPGGGFAGGVIIALGFINIMLAFGKDAALKRSGPAALRIIISVSALAFLAMAVIAVPAFDSLYRDIMMPLCEAALVGAGLFAIFTALVLLSKSDKDTE